MKNRTASLRGEVMINVPVWEKMYITFEEAAALTNIGQGKLRELAAEPDCDFLLKVGSKKGLLSRKKLEEYLNSRIEI